MGAPTYVEMIQGIGHCVTEIGRIEAELRHLRSQLGELRMAARNWRDVPEFSDRREQPVQGSEHKTLQSLEEALAYVRSQVNPDRDSLAAISGRPVVAGWYSGSRSTIGDKPYQVPRQVYDTGSNESTHAGGIQLEAETPSCGADTNKDF